MYIRKITLALTCVILLSACKKDDAPKSDIVDEIEEVEEVEEVEPVDLSESVLRDDTIKLLLYNGELAELPKKIIVGDDTFETSEIVSEFEKGRAYSYTSNDISYSFYKTELPLFSISTGDNEIVDEPKVLGQLTLLENGDKTLESNIGVELRGQFSQTFPKKSYGVELWKDEVGEDTDSESVLGMRKDDDWILDGLWNEPLRLRDYTAHELWLKMGRYPYSDQEEVTLGIKREYCELFVNGSYRGIYYLGEKVDRKQLSLKDYDDGIKGELFKGDDWQPGTLFTGVKPFVNTSNFWNGYEFEHPGDQGEWDWTNLYNLVDFVVSSDQDDFNKGIFDLVDIQNMADYYIFLNLIYAADNTGKNLYTGKYDSDSPYFFVAWDMDGSFGNKYDGTRLGYTGNTIGNDLYKRLIESPEFKSELKTRWSTLRTETTGVQSLQGMFKESYDYLKSNGTYERELMNDTLPFNSYSDTEIDFINSYISERVAQLDLFFEGL